MKIVQNRVVK